MNKNNMPRGIRNNNPANILRSGQRWLGLSELQSDSRFCQFDDMKYGVRAFFVLARTYRKKYGIKTVRDFISRFAPVSENDVDAYVGFVLGICCVVDGFLKDDLDYSCLLYSIIRFENHFSSFDMYNNSLTVRDLDRIRKEFNIKIC